MNKVRIVVLSIYILAVSACIACAQGPGFDEDVVDTPVDGGVTLIIAVTACYAAKKISNRNK